MKLKGEARTREAEAAFVEALRTAPVFAQVILERESERAGGGWDFEISLPTATVPPPFQVKAIKVGPATPAPVSAAAHPAGLPAPFSASPVRAPAAARPSTPQAPGALAGAQVRPTPPPGSVDDEAAGHLRRRPARIRPTPSKDSE